jgi:hypothetical protein
LFSDAAFVRPNTPPTDFAEAHDTAAELLHLDEQAEALEVEKQQLVVGAPSARV